MRQKSLFVVFEGLDQSGKKTLSKWLEEHIQHRGFKSRRYPFPNYDDSIGSLIKRSLDGSLNLSVETRHLLFAADRWQLYDEMKELLENGTHVIADRYSSSGIAYGIAHHLDRKWLENLEFGLLTPDLVFYVDISTDVSSIRKPDDRDLYEQQTDLLERARTAYLMLAKENGWVILNGAVSLQNLQKDVEEYVSRFLGDYEV